MGVLLAPNEHASSGLGASWLGLFLPPQRLRKQLRPLKGCKLGLFGFVFLVKLLILKYLLGLFLLKISPLFGATLLPALSHLLIILA